MFACTPPQLHLVSHFQGAAAGQFLRTFTFVNVSQRVCTLYGWPRLVDIPYRRVVQGKPVVRVVVRPGGAASFDVYGADYDMLANKPCPETSVVRVVPPGARTATAVRARMPNCRGHYVSPLVAGRTDHYSWSTTVGRTAH